MKYKLINVKTKTEHLCDKVTINGFDYYINYPEKCCIQKEGKTLMNKGCMERNHCEKTIATNNPSFDIPQVVDEVKIVSKEHFQHKIVGSTWYEVFEEGYNKSQETHPFSEEDMIEFDKYKSNLISTKKEDYPLYMLPTDSSKWLTTKELLQLWKEQKSKIVYYE